MTESNSRPDGTNWAELLGKIDELQAPRESAAEIASRIVPPAYVPRIDVDTSYMDGLAEEIAEANHVKHERAERDSANIGVTAEVMKDMLAAMQAEAEQSAERDREAKESARRNLWVGLSSMVLAALAVITPFIIEALKGWK